MLACVGTLVCVCVTKSLYTASAANDCGGGSGLSMKSIGASLLTSSVALLLGGRVASWTIGLAVVGLFLFGLGVIFAALIEYQSAGWDSEADRIMAALDEVEKNDADR